MPMITFVYAGLLLILGVGFYFGTGQGSVTALIPAFAGILFAICGGLALRGGDIRKHAMHAAAALSLLALLAVSPGVIKVIKLALGASIDRPAAAVEQAIMALLTLVFLIFCVRSFISARRASKSDSD